MKKLHSNHRYSEETLGEKGKENEERRDQEGRNEWKERKGKRDQETVF